MPTQSYFRINPCVEKIFDAASGNGLTCGYASMCGYRMCMEDYYSINVTPKYKDFSYFAIFDGNCGDYVSKCCSEHLLNFIVKESSSNFGYSIMSGFIKYKLLIFFLKFYINFL